MIAVAVVASLVVNAWVMGYVGSTIVKQVMQYKYKVCQLIATVF